MAPRAMAQRYLARQLRSLQAPCFSVAGPVSSSAVSVVAGGLRVTADSVGRPSWIRCATNARTVVSHSRGYTWSSRGFSSLPQTTVAATLVSGSSSSASSSTGGGSGSGAGGGAAAGGGEGSGRLWMFIVIVARGVVLYMPALLFWSTLVAGTPMLDLRTDEEVAEDEHEARRLELFFDVEGLSQDVYLDEWASKEEALQKVLTQLLKSRRFADVLENGVDALDADDANTENVRSRAASGASLPAARLQDFSSSVDVTYVLSPYKDGDAPNKGIQRRWSPRLLIAHRSGTLALLTLTLELVDRPKGKQSEDEEKGKEELDMWVCTALRTDLIATKGGEPTAEFISEARGPPPHGIRYMRI